MIDNRTKTLILEMSKEENKINVIWDYEKIKNIDFIELDSYRLFRFFNNNITSNFNEKNKMLNEILQESKLFTLKDEIKFLLNLTKPSFIKSELKLSFDNIFIDVNYKDKEGEFAIIGLFINFLNKDLKRELEKKIKDLTNKEIEFSRNNTIHIMSMIYKKNINNFKLLSIEMNLTNGTIIKNKEIIEEERRIIEIIKKNVLNLLLFLNEPRINLYINKTNNERRIRKGLDIIPNIIRTHIDINLEKYIYNIYQKERNTSHFNYSFWVRGHWRMLRSLKFKNKFNQQIWVIPYIKGQGIRVHQIFEVGLK